MGRDLGVNRVVLDPKSFGDRKSEFGREAGCGCDCGRETGYQDGRDMEIEDVVTEREGAGDAAGAEVETGEAAGAEEVVGVAAPAMEESGVDRSVASNLILSSRVRRGTQDMDGFLILSLRQEWLSRHFPQLQVQWLQEHFPKTSL